MNPVSPPLLALEIITLEENFKSWYRASRDRVSSVWRDTPHNPLESKNRSPIAEATVLNTGRNHMFHAANSLPVTLIPFCLNIVTHNNPARLLENVHPTAPKLLAKAVEKIAPCMIRGSART